MTATPPGARFRQVLLEESPLQVVGIINANHSVLAQQAGFRAIYVSGDGVATGSLGSPDLSINALDDVLTDIRRVTYIFARHRWSTSIPVSVPARSTLRVARAR